VIHQDSTGFGRKWDKRLRFNSRAVDGQKEEFDQVIMKFQKQKGFLSEILIFDQNYGF